jgi:hypothetical protein
MAGLLSRVLVTWIELTVVGTVGGLVGTTLGGPPGFIVYLGTTLLSVGVLLYNVDRLVAARVDGSQPAAGTGTPEDRSP